MHRGIIDEFTTLPAGTSITAFHFGSGDVQRVVDSVNALVDSVINSMNEERAIEKSKDELITNVSHDIRTPPRRLSALGLIEDKQYTVRRPPGTRTRHFEV